MTFQKFLLTALLLVLHSSFAYAQAEPAEAVRAEQIKYAEEGERLGCPAGTTRKMSANGHDVECLDRQGRRHGPYQEFCPYDRRDYGQRRRSYTFYYHGKRHGPYTHRNCIAGLDSYYYEWVGTYRDDFIDGLRQQRNSAGKVSQSCLASNSGKDEICDSTDWATGTGWITREITKAGLVVREETMDSRGRLFKVCARKGLRKSRGIVMGNYDFTSDDCSYLPGGHAVTAVEQLTDADAVGKALLRCYAFQPVAVDDDNFRNPQKEMLTPFVEVKEVKARQSGAVRAAVKAMVRTRAFRTGSSWYINRAWQWTPRTFEFTRAYERKTQTYDAWTLSKCPWR